MSLSPLPVNVTNFAAIARNRYAYIDKTPLVREIAGDKAHLFLVDPDALAKRYWCPRWSICSGSQTAFQGTWLHERWNWTRETYVRWQLT